MPYGIGTAKRKIDGKWFTLHTFTKTKRSAQFEAKAYRLKRGKPARVTEYRFEGKDYWAVWVR